MTANFNSVTLVGIVSNQPQIKVFDLEKKTIKTFFTLMVDQRGSCTSVDKAFYGKSIVPIALWGKKADYIYQVLKKGMNVLVHGKIQVGKSIKNKQVSEVVAKKILILTETTKE
ncbi:single-stranded DNA-binding protein [Candidatus Margulisiibacteriota bacterium]